MDNKIYQLVYVSSAVTAFSDEALLSLLEKSRHNNVQRQITGFLLYSEGNIIQLLEGSKQQVEMLFRIIKADARHDGIIVLYQGYSDTREFADWRMGFKQLDRLELAHDIDLFNQLLAENESDVAAIRSAKIKLLVETFRRVVRVESKTGTLAANKCLIISKNKSFTQSIRACLPLDMLSIRVEDVRQCDLDSLLNPQTQANLIVLDSAYGSSSLIDIYQYLRQQSSTDQAAVVVVDEHFQSQLEKELLEAGVDDYVVLQHSPSTLQLRLEKLLATIHTRNTLITNHRDLKQERTVIESTLVSIRNSFLPAPTTRLYYHLAPIEKTNGDILLYSEADNGKRFYLLADFQGHGLKAAVASPVIANLFHFAIENDPHMDGAKLLKALNKALCNQLPAEMFVACVLLECCPDNSNNLWNAAMPEPMLFNNGQKKRQFRSRFLPLGISPDESYTSDFEAIDIDPDDIVFLYSDGAIDCTDVSGAFLGKQRLSGLVTTCFEANQINIEKLFKMIQHIAGDELHDDVSLVAISPFK